MLLHQALRLADALIDTRQPEFLEAALEMSLTSVEREHRWIRRKTGKRRRRALADALRRRFALKAHDKSAEISTALGGRGRHTMKKDE